jgi:hypothetical protein
VQEQEGQLNNSLSYNSAKQPTNQHQNVEVLLPFEQLGILCILLIPARFLLAMNE